MSEYAPAAIRGLMDAIQAKIPGAAFLGIVGDSNHYYGYHRARNVLPSTDYSVILPKDKLGDGWAASALDIGFSAANMRLATGRLLAAAKAHDTRLHPVREFCGTTDGIHTHPYDLSNDQDGPLDSWDSGHLTHVHLSFYRQYANNLAALLPIADVIAGTPLEDDMQLTDVMHKADYPALTGDTTVGSLLAHVLQHSTAVDAKVGALKTELDATKKKLDAYVAAHP